MHFNVCMRVWCAHVCVHIKQELNPFRFLRFWGQVSFASPPRWMDVTSDCSNLYVNMGTGQSEHRVGWCQPMRGSGSIVLCGTPIFCPSGLVPWQRWSPGRWVSQSSGTRTETDCFIPSITSFPANWKTEVEWCVCVCHSMASNSKTSTLTANSNEVPARATSLKCVCLCEQVGGLVRDCPYVLSSVWGTL